MRFRRDRDDERPKVLMPLLWIQRSGYRPPRPPGQRTFASSAEPSLGDARVPGKSAFERFAAASLAPMAPASWPIEAALLLAQTLGTAYAERHTTWKPIAKFTVATGPALLTMRVRMVVEQRRARQLGLTAETAPVSAPANARAVPPLLWAGYVRLRGWRVQEPPWPRALAQSIIREVDRRRSWRAAMRARLEA